MKMKGRGAHDSGKQTEFYHRLEFQSMTAQQTQVHLRLRWGFVRGSFCLNIELGGLTWSLLSVPFKWMHRGTWPKVSLRWQDLRLKPSTQKLLKYSVSKLVVSHKEIVRFSELSRNLVIGKVTQPPNKTLYLNQQQIVRRVPKHSIPGNYNISIILHSSQLCFF
jgi:hypothetical protein